MAAGTAFDPATAGTIQGRVCWEGDFPTVPLLRGWTDVAPETGPARFHVQANPNAPAIDPRTRGMGNAVVFLRGVDPGRAKPWDLPRVVVELKDCRFIVQQGDAAGRDGFVRGGDCVEMVSTESVFHAVHAAGAAYFSLTLPDPDQPRRRTLDRNGLVELTSGAGYFWMRAYLYVDDHPYYTRTDREGRFVLRQVPPGRYQLVCLMPNWREAGHDRDPETSVVMRLRFRPSVEQAQAVEVGAGASCDVVLRFRDTGL
jgi:hypothetical protein